MNENEFLDSIENSVNEERLNGKDAVVKTKFKVYREVSGKTDTFKIGDRIKIKINGEKHFATAIQQRKDMTLFILNDCLSVLKAMKCEEESNYKNSETREFLNDCVVSKKYRDYLVPATDWYWYKELSWGRDTLFLLSVEEVFGTDSADNVQIPWFINNWKNLAATKNNIPTHWWLRNYNSKEKEFAVVTDNGNIGSCDSCYDRIGVRPSFVLRTTKGD